jgi:hypothetical protein
MEILNVNECASFNFLTQSSKRKAKSHSVKFKALNFELWFYALRFTLFAILVSLCFLNCPAAQAGVGQNYIEQWGITWTFDKDITSDKNDPDVLSGNKYLWGKFVNDDYWVVGPVKIVSIDPPSHSTAEGEKDEEGRIFATGTVINGSMINPAAKLPKHGWISAYNEVSVPYDGNCNEALKCPSLIIQPSNSLVSTISRVYTAPPLPATLIKRAAILTIVGQALPAKTFRPSYAGNSKTFYSVSNPDYSIFAKLPKVPSTPDLNQVAAYFEKPYIDYVGSSTGRTIHPSDNMPDYGSTIANNVGKTALMLNLDFSNQEKDKLIVGLVQYGIDLWGVYKAGCTSTWSMDGGHGPGRKFPILLAGYWLNDPEMMKIGEHDDNDPIFGEDQTTWYLNREYVEKWHLPLITDNPADPDINNLDWPAKVLYNGSLVNAKYQYRNAGNDMNLHRNYPDAYYINQGDFMSTTIDSASINSWVSGAKYIRDDMCKITGSAIRIFIAIKAHTSSSVNQPGSGIDWKKYWMECERDNEGKSYLGMPEYTKCGFYNSFQGRWISRRLDASYRTPQASGGLPYYGIVTAVHIMGLKKAWNHNALFDYVDRFTQLTTAGGEWYGKDVRTGSKFCADMYDTYRANYGPIWPNKATIIYGDISGDSALSAYDAALAARIAVGLDAYPTGDNLTKADVSGGGGVTAYDAALIAQKAVGLITKFPVES